jgi:pimeloyl-ACP methyl ester carboxylesterase
LSTTEPAGPSGPPLPHHRLDGPAGAPPLVLGPSLGTSTAVWEPHVPALAGRFRVLRFDLPGHGGSPTAVLPDPAPGRTTVGHLASLVLAVAAHHGWGRFHYAGVSLGGAVGAHLAAHRPDSVASLALVCSSAHFGAAPPWHERAALVRQRGPRRCWDPARTAGSPLPAQPGPPRPASAAVCSATSPGPTPPGTRRAATLSPRTT